MAKKKNVEPITGISYDPDNKLIVQKSRPLQALWRSELTLSEFKILDTYLSRIDSHKPEKRLVRFEKGELELLLGVKKINTPELKERMKHLMGNVVEIQDDSFKKGFQLVTLFETAECTQDDYGLWQVDLECTQKAMKYFFNIEDLTYFRYKLRSVTSIQSRYSYVLFMYLESKRNPFHPSWSVPLDELKQILNCDKEETYKEFKHFNNLILKKATKELLEKTECRFSYEPIKSGRRVTAIQFTLDPLKNPAPQIDPVIPGQLTFDDYDGISGDPNAIYVEALEELNYNFTSEQIEALKTLAWKKVVYSGGALPKECYVADYLRMKAVKMNALGKPIKLPYNYLVSMIEKDPDVI